MPVPHHLRGDLLPAVCHHLPEPESILVRSMDPDEYLTHVEAYISIRSRHVELPDSLLEDFVTGIVDYHERPRALV